MAGNATSTNEANLLVSLSQVGRFYDRQLMEMKSNRVRAHEVSFKMNA